MIEIHKPNVIDGNLRFDGGKFYLLDIVRRRNGEQWHDVPIYGRYVGRSGNRDSFEVLDGDYAYVYFASVGIRSEKLTFPGTNIKVESYSSFRREATHSNPTMDTLVRRNLERAGFKKDIETRLVEN